MLAYLSCWDFFFAVETISFAGAITPLPSAEQKACQAPKPILLNTVSFGPLSHRRHGSVLIISLPLGCR